jgi:hypothetical protein
MTAAGKERVLINRERRWCGRERLNTTGFGIYNLKISFGLEREEGWRRV